ncbi:MAG: hypothetical protein AB1410_10120 [Acidobacteriota bacterium]
MEGILERLESIEKRKDHLVKEAEKLCNDYGREKIPETAQLQNLRTVAFSTSSIEEIKNYIKYQMGRIKEWFSEKEGKKFGDALIKKIEEEKTYFSSNPDTALYSIRLFIGYLIRYAKYLEKIGGEGEKRP